MQNYDLIIVGAGIAGCGLAYNLKRMGYKGSVLIIDKEEVGANAGYGYRNTSENIVKEYNLPYEHIYKGVKVGLFDKTYFTLNRKFYFIDYKKACKHLLKNSYAEFKKEKAIKQNKNILETDKNKYGFKVLADCSGHYFFAKRLHNQQLPFRYWVGKTKVLKNRLKDTNHHYSQFNDSGYFEDIYPLKNKTLQGDWQYTKKIDFSLIESPKKNLYKKYFSDPKIIREDYVVIPCVPAFPLVYKNITYLGDSFGNASTSAAEGISTTLKTSEILASAIKKQNLTYYERNWKRRYLETYIRYLTSKYYNYHSSELIKKIKKIPKKEKVILVLKKHPEFFENMLTSNPDPSIPIEIAKEYPRRHKLFLLYYYLYLKLKYALMN